jgi:hypothetical protein
MLSKVRLCPAEFAISPDEELILVAILMRNCKRGFAKEDFFWPSFGRIRVILRFFKVQPGPEVFDPSVVKLILLMINNL